MLLVIRTPPFVLGETVAVVVDADAVALLTLRVGLLDLPAAPAFAAFAASFCTLLRSRSPFLLLGDFGDKEAAEEAAVVAVTATAASGSDIGVAAVIE